MKKPTQRQKIQEYECLLHSLSLSRMVGNTQKINEMLDRIDDWSYAHRCGNGTLTDRQQNELIKKAFWRINER
jgi:hypothetical protein